jgi:hypothetical protein
MDGRGIASDTISYQPLLIGEKKKDKDDGEEFFLRPITSSCGSATAGDREKEKGRSIQSY